MTEHQLGQSSKWWIFQLSPHFELGIVERAVVMLRRGLDRVVLRLIRLQNHVAAKQAAPRAPGHLAEHLKGSLRRPVVRQVQANIGQHHTNKGNQR